MMLFWRLPHPNASQVGNADWPGEFGHFLKLSKYINYLNSCSFYERIP